MKLFKRLRKKSQPGFTLIELLATLTIMAIISGILFPFMGNYTARAKKSANLRSLRLFEDAMDRYRALNITLDESQWGSAEAPTVDDYYLLSSSYINNVIEDITEPGEYQTLRLPGQTLTNSNVVIVRTGPSPAWEWEVMRYREEHDENGVDRKGNIIDISQESFSNPGNQAIKNAFDND